MLHTTMFFGYACNRLGTFFNLLVWIGPWRVVEHVNDWCFRDIYEGGLCGDDLYVSVPMMITVYIVFMFSVLLVLFMFFVNY